MDLRVYNTISRKKEKFTPLHPPYVGMYVCGPTVYGHSHLGHARSYVVPDVIYRYLTHLGYKVRYIQNITDVGHLVSDQDHGDDKIMKQAQVEQMEPMEIAYKYEVSYFEDMDRLNILRPSISTRATGHILEMIELIEQLINKKHAYVTKEGNVYFDIRSFDDYGKLSGRHVEDTQEGERIENAQDKRFPQDFALWKKAEKTHLMHWNSPWSVGYPGWHIECSVMSMKYIGETLDIHCGGLDNIFPHHECEIAQSESLTGKPFVRFFIHHNLLTVNGTKMGKSLGNFIILKDLFQRIPPVVLRFYILQGHYRSPLDFTYESLEATGHGFERLKKSIFSLRKAVHDYNASGTKTYEDVESIKTEMSLAMNDDFNTPRVIALLFDLVKLSNIELSENKPDLEKMAQISKIIKIYAEDILGLKFETDTQENTIEDHLIEMLIGFRNNFRTEKRFDLSDQIRDQLQSLGITIKDSKDGTSYTR